MLVESAVTGDSDSAVPVPCACLSTQIWVIGQPPATSPCPRVGVQGIPGETDIPFLTQHFYAGEKGSSGLLGFPGMPGLPGVPGVNGFKGAPGTAGGKGSPGAVGLQGQKGEKQLNGFCSRGT